MKKEKFKNKEIEGAVIWLKGEMTLTEYSKLTKVMQATSTYIKLSRALREAFNQGIIKINE